jgi:Ca2+-binding EF-hand superfamily protein
MQRGSRSDSALPSSGFDHVQLEQPYVQLGQPQMHEKAPEYAVGEEKMPNDSHWKWAFRALEQRNKELEAENEAMKQKVVELTGLSEKAAAALSKALAAATAAGLNRSAADSTAEQEDLVSEEEQEAPPSLRSSPRPKPMVRSSSERQESSPTKLPRIRISRSASEGTEGAEGGSRSAPVGRPGVAIPRPPPRPSPAASRVDALESRARGSMPPSLSMLQPGEQRSKRDIAREYAKRVPRPARLGETSSPQPPRGVGFGSSIKLTRTGNVASPPQGSLGPNRQPLRGKGSEASSQHGVDTQATTGTHALLDEEMVDFVAFCTYARDLEPSRQLDESELRGRFDELGPGESKMVYMQDYRLTLLFKTLSGQSARVLDLFRGWDSDGSASIDRSEFHEGLEELGFKYSSADIDLVFSHLDTDGSGTIDYVELNSKLRPRTCAQQAYKLRTGIQLKRGSQKQIAVGGKQKRLQRGPGAPPIADQLQVILRNNFLKVLDVFKMYDTNDDGTVDKREFADGLNALGYDAPRAEFDALFDTFDRDGSGSLDYYEVYAKLRAGRKSSTSPTKKDGTRRRRQSERSEGGRSEGGRSEGGRSEGGRSEGRSSEFGHGPPVSSMRSASAAALNDIGPIVEAKVASDTSVREMGEEAISGEDAANDEIGSPPLDVGFCMESAARLDVVAPSVLPEVEANVEGNPDDDNARTEPASGSAEPRDDGDQSTAASPAPLGVDPAEAVEAEVAPDLAAEPEARNPTAPVATEEAEVDTGNADSAGAIGDHGAGGDAGCAGRAERWRTGRCRGRDDKPRVYRRT